MRQQSATIGRECNKLIRAGKASLGRVETSQDGKKRYIYQVKMPNGQDVEYGSEKDILNVPLFNKNMYTNLFGEFRNDNGMIVPSVWVICPDGTPVAVPGDINMKWDECPLHEIPALIDQGKGRPNGVTKLKDGKQLYLYEFTLSNGEKVKYGSLDKTLATK